MTTTIRAAIYCRVSSPGQAAEGTTSLDDQERACRALAERLGWTVAAVYREPGFTGTTDDRPQWGALMRAARSREYDKVIALNLKRLARRAKVGLEIADQLNELGVGLAVTDIAVDFGDKHGRLLLTLLLGMAEWDLEGLLEQMAGGARAKFLSGRYVGGRVARGYRVEYDRSLPNPRDQIRSGRLVADLEERAWLVPAVDRLTQGWGVRRTARWLADQGVRDRKGRVISGDALGIIMKSPTLHGSFRWSAGRDATGKYGPPIHVQHPDPVVSLEAFEAMRAAIGSRHRAPDPASGNRPYPLTGRLTSPCGRSASGWFKNTPTRAHPDGRALYRCAGRKRAPSCGCKAVSADQLEARVARALREQFTPDRLLALAGAYLGLAARTDSPPASDGLERARGEVVRLERRLSEAAAEWARAGVSPAVVAAGARALEDDLTAARQRLAAIERARAAAGQAEQVARGVEQLAELAAARLAEPTPERLAELLAVLRVGVTLRASGGALVEGVLPLGPSADTDAAPPRAGVCVPFTLAA